jgi:hypothetical protein
MAKNKVKSMLNIFFDIKGELFTKNSSWQAKQSIPHTTVTFSGDCAKLCTLGPDIWRQKNWLLHHNAPGSC